MPRENQTQQSNTNMPAEQDKTVNQQQDKQNQSRTTDSVGKTPTDQEQQGGRTSNQPGGDRRVS